MGMREPIGVVPQDEVDHVLLEWFEWGSADTAVCGYSSADSSCREFRSSRQWDESYLDDEVASTVRKMVGEAADPLVMSLPTDWRVAVMTHVRNMAAGAAVFRNPRRPEYQDVDYAAAKIWLRPKFISKGLLS